MLAEHFLKMRKSQLKISVWKSGLICKRIKFYVNDTGDYIQLVLCAIKKQNDSEELLIIFLHVNDVTVSSIEQVSF